MELEHVTQALSDVTAHARESGKVGALLLDPPVLEALPEPTSTTTRRAYGCRVSGCYVGEAGDVVLLLVHPRGTLMAPEPARKPLPRTPVLLVLGVLAPQARLIAPVVAAMGRAAARGKLQIWTLEAATELPSSEDLGKP